jgi:hypothetical protein
MTTKILLAIAALLGAPAALAAEAAQIEITDQGLQPSQAVVPSNGQLTFVNRSSRPHQIDSDPHPVHNSCPWLNGKTLAPGESATVKAPSSGRCTFHDHFNPTEQDLHGSVSVAP